jgi:excisionase family DNA binding protein
VSEDSQIALALVDALDDRALDLLAERLAPRLGAGAMPSLPPAVYTVATLAGELDVSERAVRGWIHRGELDGVKRGRTYVITRSAVEAWAAPGAGRPRGSERSSRERPHRAVMASALARLDGER